MNPVPAIADAVHDGADDGSGPADRPPVSIPVAQWRAAGTVVLDAQAAEAVLRAGLPARDRVLLVAAGRATMAHWQMATELAAPGVIVLPRDEAQLVHRLGDSGARQASGGVIAVIGARGGAGASCFATALAYMSVRTATPRAARTLLIDGDPLGGGLDLLLGWEERAGIRWPELVAEQGRIAADALFAALPHRGRVALLAAARPSDVDPPDPKAMRAILDGVGSAGDRAIVDCPRGADPAADVALQLADLVVLVCPATTTALAAAGPVLRRLRGLTPDVGLVVRGPSALGRRPREIADLLEVPLLAAMRPEPGLDVRIDRQGWSPSRRTVRRSPLLGAASAVLNTVDVSTDSMAAGSPHALGSAGSRRWPASRDRR